MIERNCGQCALKHLSSGTCPFFAEVTDNDQGCPRFIKNGDEEFCAVCGNILLSPKTTFLDVSFNPPVAYCANCQKIMGTCRSCIHGGDCLFQTDPSDLPQFIQKQIRQGNMITVTEIPNPERVDKTCKKGCPCFDPEYGCLKQNNTCNKWHVCYDKGENK